MSDRMMDSVIAGIWAGYGLAVPVGAVAVLLINLTARTSFRTGAAAALGATTADALYAVAAVLGGSALAAVVQPFSGPLRWAGAAILVLMAVRIAATALGQRRENSPPQKPEAAAQGPFRSYLTFFGLTALNPWPAIYFAALVLGRRQQNGQSLAEEFGYVAAIVAASASWQLLLAGGGAVLGRFLTGRRGRVVTALLSSALIASLAVGVVVSA